MIRESLTAMREGTPRLMFLGRPEELREHDRDGVVTVPIACQSEGALEVYVEPVLPHPQLVAIGRSPAVDGLVSMAHALDWSTVLVDDGGRIEDHPRADRVLTSLDLSGVEWAVLSACDTGLGDIKAGEGVFGLRRAFQVAGAKTVVMSVWAVEDESVRQWMKPASTSERSPTRRSRWPSSRS